MAKAKPQSIRPPSEEESLSASTSETPPATQQELDALLGGVEPVDLNQEYELALRAGVPRTRGRVGQAVQGNGNKPATETKKAPGFAVFGSLIEKDTDLRNVCTSLGMVCGLLRDIYKNQGDSVIEHAGFNQENLHELLEDIIGSIKGEPFPLRRVMNLMKREEWTAGKVIYYGILDLKDDSTEKEIRAKCEALKKETDPFEEFLTFLSVENVNKVLIARKDPKNAGVSTADLVKARKLVGKSFDEEVLKGKSAEAQGRPVQKPASKSAPKATSATEGMEMLRRLQGAFKNPDKSGQYFDGEDVAAVVGWLNTLGSKPGLGNELLLASMDSTDSTDAHALLQKIAESFDIKDPETLEQKLADIYLALRKQYPNLLPAPAPAQRKTVQKTPSAAPARTATAVKRGGADSGDKVSGATIDYKAFYEELEEKPIPLYHLFYALKRSPAVYDEKDRDLLFKKQSQSELMGKIDEVLGSGMAAALQEAARKPDAHYLTALIQVIAERFRLTNPAHLKGILKQITQRLGARYPGLLSY